MPPVEPNEEEQQQELPQDNGQTPFQPAAPAPDDATIDPQTAVPPPIDNTHPATDTAVDKQELYDEGVSGAVEIQEPSETAVTGFQEPEEPQNLS